MKTLQEKDFYIKKHEIIDCTEIAMQEWFYEKEYHKWIYLYRDNKDTWIYRLCQDATWYRVERDKAVIRTYDEAIDYFQNDDFSDWDSQDELTYEEAMSIITENV